MTELLHRDLTYAIIGAAMEVHKTPGTAFLERVYELALAHELDLRGIPYERQAGLPVFYKDRQVGWFKADPSATLRTCFVVDGKTILELKAVKAINEIHEAQAHNYLAASGLRLAIILNFGAPSLEFKRVVN